MTWVNMLRSINGVSEAAANRIASHFGSAKNLINALNDSSKSIEERQLLLQDKMSTSSKSSKNVSKLSRRVFRIFTCVEDVAMINSDGEDG